MGQFSIASSSITLSPKITVSNSPVSMSRLRIRLQGFESALASMAQTPIVPIFGSFDTSAWDFLEAFDVFETVRLILAPSDKRVGIRFDV